MTKTKNLKSQKKAAIFDKLMGENVSKFGTLDEAEFKKKLDNLAHSETDLENYALNFGYRSDGNIKELKSKLLQAFREHTRNTIKPINETKTAKKISPTVLKIMAEGR